MQMDVIAIATENYLGSSKRYINSPSRDASETLNSYIFFVGMLNTHELTDELILYSLYKIKCTKESK